MQTDILFPSLPHSTESHQKLAAVEGDWKNKQMSRLHSVVAVTRAKKIFLGLRATNNSFSP